MMFASEPTIGAAAMFRVFGALLSRAVSLVFAHLLAELRDGSDIGDVVEDAGTKRRLGEGVHCGQDGGIGVHRHLFQRARNAVA